MGVYIDAAGAEALKHYQYKGADLSKIYIHILQPLNTFLLNHIIPMWLSPNLMSLIGLSTTTLACAVAAYYNMTFDSLTVPGWVSVYVALSFFIYQTIDNCDGRQARRTNSSSPLGLLFDHGVDALTVTIGALTLGSVFNFGIDDIRLQYIFWLCGCVPFIFATTTEYWTSELILGVINGPSDGMCICMGFCIAQYFIPNLWSHPIRQHIPLLATYMPAIADWSMNAVILAAGIAGVVPTIANNVLSISRHKNLLDGPIQLFAPFLSLVAMSATWMQYSPAQVFQHNTRTFIATAGILFANVVCKLMLAHITAKRYNVFRLELLPYAAAVLHALFVPVKHQLLTERHTLYALLVYVVAMHAHFVMHVIDDMTEILQIQCFSITKQRAHPVAEAHTNGQNGNQHVEHGKAP